MKLCFFYDKRTYTLIDREASYYGAEPLIIDPNGAFKRDRIPEAVDSLSQALILYPDHQWVFMHPDGYTQLSQYVHPAEPTIYAVGDNITGFGLAAEELPGDAVCLCNPEIVWDYQAAQMALYDRSLYLAGRRA